MQSLKILPWEESKNRLLLERGNRLYSEHLGETREMISRALIDFNLALKSQNPERIKQVYSSVKEFFDKLDNEE